MLAGNLDDIIESSFLLSYHANIQPSEVDNLSTFEFNKYLDLLNVTRNSDREYDLQVAQTYGIGRLFSKKRGDT